MLLDATGVEEDSHKCGKCRADQDEDAEDDYFACSECDLWFSKSYLKESNAITPHHHHYTSSITIASYHYHHQYTSTITITPPPSPLYVRTTMHDSMNSSFLACYQNLLSHVKTPLRENSRLQ